MTRSILMFTMLAACSHSEGIIADEQPLSPKCHPPAAFDPYEMCLMRECDMHACQFAYAAPEVARRCGLSCMDDEMPHAHCPIIAGKVTEPKVCGWDPPPAEACMVFGPPLVDEASAVYCCTDDASHLPVDCTADAECATWSPCQYAECLAGRCVVNFEVDGTQCDGGVCFDGVCMGVE